MGRKPEKARSLRKPVPFKNADDSGTTFVKPLGGERFKNRAICNVSTKKVSSDR